jgi:hypothetical protein
MNGGPSEVKPPRVADFLLRLLVPPEERTALLGDLEETFGKKQGPGAALWYWRETILTIFHANVRAIQKRPTLVLGTMGFAVLVGIMSRLSSLFALFSFPALMFAMAIILRSMNIAPFSRRFAWTLTAFMVPMLVIYVMVFNPAIPLWGYAWRLAFIVALGAFSASIVAGFSSKRASPFLPFPFFPVFAYAFIGSIRPAPPAFIDAFLSLMPGALLGRHYLRGWGMWFSLVDLLLWSAIGWALMNRLNTGVGGPEGRALEMTVLASPDGRPKRPASGTPRS